MANTIDDNDAPSENVNLNGVLNNYYRDAINPIDSYEMLCETFLKGSDTPTDYANILKIEEYDFIYKNRIHKSKGGGGGRHVY